MRHILFAIFLAPAALLAALEPSDPYQPRDTQPGPEKPPTAEEVVRLMKLPEGFSATVFAAEPDVRQPIDMKMDDRGRIWVCEGYSYKEWEKKGEDRIIILEDRDNDGRAEHRKVFRGGFHHLSSVEIGHGGVWVIDSPNLLFFPDANGDDVPDGPAKVVLDGWTEKGGHNVASGLQWGVDGWLYGRHGITQPSLVGKPGTPEKDRTFLEPGIWRVHPKTEKFEVIVKGTTNPWGLDWDSRYEMFMSGNVNGHLWHCLPGSLFERMFGSGSVPHDYERLKMIGEQPHYQSSGDWKQDWLRAEKGRDAKNDLGGGHSHCGLMIYQGDNWPERYRGRAFMCNTHGRRVNEEALEQTGSSYVSKHVGDVLTVGTQWFRGVSLLYGPDGAVFLSDWCDNGECHDDDGVHRSSGRIYKISYGKPKLPEWFGEFSKWDHQQMVSALTHPNEWYFRRAVRRIAHAAASETKALQIPDVKPTDPPAWHLRRLLMLGAVGQMDRVRKSGPFPPDSGGKTLSLTVDLENLVAVASAAELGRRLLEEIRVAEHPLTLMRLAWYLKDCDPADAAQGMALLLGKKELIGDARAELVLWHNWEAIFERTAPVILPANSPEKLVNFAARRSHAVGSDSAHLRSLMQQVSTWPQKPLQAAALDGLLEASNGRTGLAAPSGWAAFRDALQSGHPTAITRLALAFGDESVAVKLAALVKNRSAAAQERRDGLQALAVCRSPLAAESVRLAMQESDLRPTAIPHLAVLLESEVETLLWPIWPTLGAAEKSAAIDVLTTRRSWAKSLLAKVADAVVSQKEISLGQARQISLLKDAGVNALLEKHWGKVGASRKDHEDAIAKYRMMLTDNKTASAERGRAVYGKACAVCHKLFGEGGSLGPDLTGSGRKELDYLLLNVINPNAAVPRDYQMIVVEMKDGQVLTGTMPREDETSVTLQTLTEKRILNRSELRKVERQSLSWMPEGLFQQLTDQEVADLVAYLRKE